MRCATFKRSYSEQMQRLVEEYRADGQPWPAPARDIALWMIRTNRWDRGDKTLVDLCARDISTAMRQEFHTDPQGRRVRTKHSANIPSGKAPNGQLALWDDMRTAPRAFMERAFKQRRHQIVGDCVQLSTDVDSYNDNSSSDDPIPMLFDFQDDVAESKFSGEINEGASDAQKPIGRDPLSERSERDALQTTS